MSWVRLGLLPRHALMLLVRAYQLMLSPWLRAGCRYEPTCSGYALEALRRHGAVLGTGLSAWRILRCHPWCLGGPDPVPEHWPGHGLFTRLVQRADSSRTPPPP